jgi:hypothetical protein
MGSSVPNKTSAVTALAHQAATHPITIAGDAIDVSTWRNARLFMFHGYVEDTADTNKGSFLVQIKPDATSLHWVTVATQESAGTDPDTEAISADEAVGQTVLSVASTTGFALLDKVYIQDTTLAEGEWGTLTGLVTDTSLEVLDATTYAHAKTTSVIWNDATIATAEVDCTSAAYLRLVWTHTGATGANAHVKGIAVGHFEDCIR